MKQVGRAARRCSLPPARTADARQRPASHAISRVARSSSAPGARHLQEMRGSTRGWCSQPNIRSRLRRLRLRSELQRRHGSSGSQSRCAAGGRVAAPAQLRHRPSCSAGRVAAPAGRRRAGSQGRAGSQLDPESQSNRKPGDPKEHALRSRGSLDVWQERLITSHGLARWFDSMGSMDATPSRRDRSPSARESRNPTLDVNERATTGS